MIAIRLYFIGVVLCLLSCGQKKDQYLVIVGNSDGLQKGSEVVFNGATVGSVSKLKILPDLRILLSLSVNKDFRIPLASKFIVTEPLIGSTRLILEKSKNPSFATKDDTLYAILDTIDHSRILNDTTKRKALNKIVEGFKELIESPNKDTIK
jgi:ABC-type transporter Mla subunit MlaD